MTYLMTQSSKRFGLNLGLGVIAYLIHGDHSRFVLRRVQFVSPYVAAAVGCGAMSFWLVKNFIRTLSFWRRGSMSKSVTAFRLTRFQNIIWNVCASGKKDPASSSSSV